MNNLMKDFMGFDGRINRQRWWIAGIVLAIVQFIVSWIINAVLGIGMGADPATMAANLPKIGWVGLVIGIIFAYPWLAITIKRRHDRNNNGNDIYGFIAVELIYYLVLGIVGTGIITTIVGLILFVFAIYILVVCGFQKGTAGPNTYGPDPLQG